SSRRRHTRWPRDWSSDVCSSDLRADARVDRMRRDLAVADAGGAGRDRTVGAGAVRRIAEDLAADQLPAVVVVVMDERWARWTDEIGRASCRERVERAVGGGAVRG